MEEELKIKRTLLQYGVSTLPTMTTKLWCGRVQMLCDGSLCSDCHLFQNDSKLFDVEKDSIIDKPSLTDHKNIGMTREED